MKQHIVSNQLNELSSDAKQRLYDWWSKDRGMIIATGYETGCQWIKPLHDGLVEMRYLPYLTIGEMIAFLDEHGSFHALERNDDPDRGARWLLGKIEGGKGSQGGFGYVLPDHEGDELCDVLWEVCKEVLERE